MTLTAIGSHVSKSTAVSTSFQTLRGKGWGIYQECDSYRYESWRRPPEVKVQHPHFTERETAHLPGRQAQTWEKHWLLGKCKCWINPRRGLKAQAAPVLQKQHPYQALYYPTETSFSLSLPENNPPAPVITTHCQAGAADTGCAHRPTWGQV